MVFVCDCTIVCIVQNKNGIETERKRTQERARAGNMTAQISKIITTISLIVDVYLPCYFVRRQILHSPFASFPLSFLFSFLLNVFFFCPSFFAFFAYFLLFLRL